MTEQPIRDAATVILYRTDGSAPRVLMGQRQRNAIFMPDKFVFPGGRVDKADGDAQLTLTEHLYRALSSHSRDFGPEAIVAAGIREVREETGLRIANLDAMRFVFRAVTPPGRPRRFDARFLLAPASSIAGNPDDLSGDNELTDLTWIEIPEARRLPLPFITEVVLAEIEAILRHPDEPRPIPFFKHEDGVTRVVAL
jgi:8-oxo-dGTP pyrophosphatase MutT (NUDIX family)